ncbi:hypothetical protein SAMN02745134_03377 [Clostridium acidisoli DSM 12555]|uniref:Uncharacterized protein n=1 Tax=Clostridium acidisoli DSM 12555 TaxID=1121291 RepID=A0A1W1XVY1_9CLOT|nr:hypothetical protein [Clostridium acidisoli]SMC28015.1 hypothetical protein SAMN02745134_03377 [Clostridium acidisoli DSM 12555]
MDHNTIDTTLIDQEAAFDGFYAVCTNLENEASTAIKAKNITCFLIITKSLKTIDFNMLIILIYATP